MTAKDNPVTRQERREARLRSRRERMKQHGRGFARAYRDAVIKRSSSVRRRGRR